MSENQSQNAQFKKVIIDQIIYTINEDEKTASMYGLNENIKDVYIPRSIIIGNKEYIITRILKNSLTHRCVSHVQFAPDSEVQVFEQYSFSQSSIEKISIPASVKIIGANCFNYCSRLKTVEIPANSELTIIEKDAFVGSIITSFFIPPKLISLQEGWCNFQTFMNKITVSPDNPCFKMYEGQYLIGKKTPQQENFDVLVFSIRKIQKAIIPNFIEIIAPFAFCYCNRLKTVEFESDSKLRIIEKSAFHRSSIESIKLPQHLNLICEKAFDSCGQLKSIEIPENIELQTIEKDAFHDTQIGYFFIPASLINIDFECFSNIRDLNRMTVSPDNPFFRVYDNKFIIKKSSLEKENYDILSFAFKVVTKATIPSFIEVIQRNSFCGCFRLTSIEFEEDSKLRIIEENAFHTTQIESINVPPSLEKICKNAFKHCESFREFNAPENSKLKTIEDSAFFDTSIESLTIPASLVELGENWCQNLNDLTKIQISPNNPVYSLYDGKYIVGKSSLEQPIFDVLVFAIRDIKIANIPDCIKVIGNNAFQYCIDLKIVDISEHSNLTIIGSNSFNDVIIRSIKIPAKTTQIKDESFQLCDNLKRVEFANNSQLKSIGKDAFSSTPIDAIDIPVHLTQIDKSAFSYCKQLRRVIIPQDSELTSIGDSAFFDSAIEHMFIPSGVENIKNGTFAFCYELKIVELGEKSKIKSINTKTFDTCENVRLMIPANLTIQIF